MWETLQDPGIFLARWACLILVGLFPTKNAGPSYTRNIHGLLPCIRVEISKIVILRICVIAFSQLSIENIF